MAIIKSKKAIFFSLIAILMSTLFVLLFSSMYHVPFDSKAVSDANNLEQVNQLVGDLSEFVDSVNSVSSVLTFNDLSLKSPVDNATTEFISCFEKGTFENGSKCSDTSDHSFDTIFNTFLVKAKKAYNLNLNYSILNVTVKQKTPYTYIVDAIVLLNITYYDASWNRIINSSQEVSIVGVTDPSTVSTTFQRNISLPLRAFASSFIKDQFYSNYTLIKDYVKNGYSFIDYSAPSFFNELEGKYTTNSSMGIASFVPDDISYPGNRTAFVSYLFKSKQTYSTNFLKRINTTGLNTNFALTDAYLKAMKSYDTHCKRSVNPELLNVSGCCNSTGCDPSCGYISVCNP